MKNKLILFFCFTYTFIIKAQIMWQINPDTVIVWNYQEGDEFNSDNINLDMWSYTYGWARTIYANKEQQYYSDGKNHLLKNGLLHLTAKKETIVARTIDQYNDEDTIKNNGKFYSLNKTQFNYSSGMIQSRKKFKNGYFECRVKLPKQNGYWPAFWLYGGSPNEEIDMLEGKTERPTQIHIDTHCPNKCDLVNLFLQKRSYGGWVKTKTNFVNGYNIIACDWNSERIKFYLNGECIGVVNVKFEAEKHIVFNLAVPSNNGPFKPGPSLLDSLQATYKIDYVRVWSTENKMISFDKNIKQNQVETNVETNNPISSTSISKSKGKLTFGKKSEHKNESIFISFFDHETNLQLYALGVFNLSNPVYSIKDAFGKEVQVGIIDRQIYNINKLAFAKGDYSITINYNKQTVAKKFTIN